MPKIFQTLDKIKPAYDVAYKFVLFVCKLLLTADIVITSVCVVGRYVSFVPDPAWSEEVVLTLMSYMAVLSAALAIRRNAHIRMTAFDAYLPKNVIKALDILADVAVFILAIVMITVGFSYATGIGAKGNYVSMPWLSKFWMYFPIPLAYGDVYAGLEQQVVDGAENNWPSYEAMRHYEVAKYYTVDEHTRVPEMQICSAYTWQKLSPEDREIIAECARESALYEREVWTQREEQSRSIAIENGTKVVELSAEEKKRFQNAVYGVYEKYCGDDMGLIEEILKEGS